MLHDPKYAQARKPFLYRMGTSITRIIIILINTKMLLLRMLTTRTTLFKVAFGMAAKNKKDLYCK